MPWRKIAALEEFGGSSAGMLANIHNGYEPKTAETRKRLGLAPKTIPIEPCPVHNIVHCWDCQTEQVQPLKAPRPKRNRTRIAADVTTEQRDGLNDNLDYCGISRRWLFGLLGELSNRQFSELVLDLQTMEWIMKDE